MKKSNVLVTASGGIVAQGIIKCLNIANKQKKSDTIYKIIATDISAKAPGLYRADEGVLVRHALQDRMEDGERVADDLPRREGGGHWRDSRNRAAEADSAEVAQRVQTGVEGRGLYAVQHGH